MRGETEPGESCGEKVAGSEAECRKSGRGADWGGVVEKVFPEGAIVSMT